MPLCVYLTGLLAGAAAAADARVLSASGGRRGRPGAALHASLAAAVRPAYTLLALNRLFDPALSVRYAPLRFYLSGDLLLMYLGFSRPGPATYPCDTRTI